MPEAGKVFDQVSEAIADFRDGVSVCVGGFGPPHNRPATLLKALAERGCKNLTLIANVFSYQPLAENEQVRTFIGAFGCYDDCRRVCTSKPLVPRRVTG